MARASNSDCRVARSEFNFAEKEAAWEGGKQESKGKSMTSRKSLLSKAALAGAASIMALAGAAFGQESEIEFDLEPQPLSDALIEFSETSDIIVMASAELVEGKSAPAISGALEPSEALERLLRGSGLTTASTDNGTIVLTQAVAEAPEEAESQSNFQLAQLDTQAVRQPVDAAETELERRRTLDRVIVTGQKREEYIQDVPIAISAFSGEQLDAQKIEGGFDLLKSVPNVTFSKTNFSSYNFQIRGIGTQAVSATTDPAVAVSFNNTALIVNRLFEQEYVDIERVEVLRGPQGTLYGRNATAGVINVISAQPEMENLFGEVELETGNYNARRARGHVNLPLGEQFALRLAGAVTVRDGYAFNEASLEDPSIESDIDDRNLWTARATLGWQPTSNFRADLLWERFEEDDRRVRSTKVLCNRDEPPEFIGDLETSEIAGPGILTAALVQSGGFFSQGCEPGSLFDDESFQSPYGASLQAVSGAFFTSLIGGRDTIEGLPPGQLGMGFLAVENQDCAAATAAGIPFFTLINACNLDIFGGRDQSRDLRSTYQPIEPEYFARSDIFNLSAEWDVSESLTLASETVYVDDEYYSTQDISRFKTNDAIFGDTAAACDNFLAGVNPAAPCNPGQFEGGYYADIAPGGVFTDPQLGASSTFLAQDLSRSDSQQFSQELRLHSAFQSDWNFSLGANYTHFETKNDYFVLGNLYTAIALTPYFRAPGAVCNQIDEGCIYIDPQPLETLIDDENPEGHNYFLSQNPFELNSTAVFGEVYWNATDTLKLTGGLRLTWDEKTFTPIPSQLLLFDYRQRNPFANFIPDVDPDDTSSCTDRLHCRAAGNAPDGRGFVAEPDIVQSWEEPTGRIGFDWQPDLGFSEETLIYGFYTRGYKAGGANPPPIAEPAGIFVREATNALISPTFDAEYVDAFEIGSKNTLLGGRMTLNGAAFFYDYEDYQTSQILDRQAVTSNYDAQIWGAELEALFAPTERLVLNASLGYLKTEIGKDERAIDIMDRAQGGNQSFTTPDGVTYDEWIVLKPWIQDPQNCVAPVEIVEAAYSGRFVNAAPGGLCFGGDNQGGVLDGWNPLTDAPNAGAGFYADLSGNELPNAPNWTFSAGAQYTLDLPGGWEGTGRADFYWQDESYHRVFNTEYDRLESWTNTNLSFWIENAEYGVTVEAYVKNVFDKTPITGAFLNSEELGLSTNVFTLDPRLWGISVSKSF